jgi:DNA repair protein SbcC/Rad50
MEILSVTLKNFKVHVDRHFTFQPGTNAISGENGAGKTSILEAIAWTLFNHRGAYNKEDLIRNGAGSAQARIAFISSRDGRTYEVERCTLRGYTVFDPQLSSKIDLKHIEEEILPWLRQQMGVAPGTDLARLFANTIGVPQGMFTADFLQAADKRKSIFDSVLKVEEYRQTAQSMLSLEKYAKAESEKVEMAIAQYDDTLKDWDGLQQQQQQTVVEMAASEAQLQQLRTELDALQTERDQLQSQAQTVQQTTTQVQQLSAQVEGKRQSNLLLQESVKAAQVAVDLCEQHRPNYEQFLATEAQLQTLDEQMKERRKIAKQMEAQQQLLTEKQTEVTRLNLQLEALSHAATAITQLVPLVQQQADLEQQQAATIEHLNRLQGLKSEQTSLTKQHTRLQADVTGLTAAIERVQGLAALVQTIAGLEEKRDRTQQQLSRVEAAKQFEAELRALVTAGEDRRDRHKIDTEAALQLMQQLESAVQSTAPLLANDSFEQTIKALQSGVALNTDLINALWRILADLSEQLSVPKLQQQLQQTKVTLESAYQARGEVANLTEMMARQSQLHREAAEVEARLQALKTELIDEKVLQQQRLQLIADLAQLQNPRGRRDLLNKQLEQQQQIQAQATAIATEFEALETAIAQLQRTLEQFAEVEVAIEAQKQIRQSAQAGYRIYLQQQNTANQLEGLTETLQTAIAQLEALAQDRDQMQAQRDQLMQAYDPVQAKTVETTYNQIRSQADHLAGGLPQQQKLLDSLNQRLNELQETAEKRDRTQKEYKQKERVRKFITFARKVYRDAGPRITERYVQSISHEGDRLFRELLNRPNVALEWTKDYEILVQEGAHTRRFVNLSGGEQMCAALAVRLALLRVMADIDVAFFDEPTTNMDRPRRESLAEAIANIKSFRQLFVISHDDTFEKVTENVIVVARELD